MSWGSATLSGTDVSATYSMANNTGTPVVTVKLHRDADGSDSDITTEAVIVGKTVTIDLADSDITPAIATDDVITFSVAVDGTTKVITYTVE